MSPVFSISPSASAAAHPAKTTLMRAQFNGKLMSLNELIMSLFVSSIVQSTSTTYRRPCEGDMK